MSTIKATRRPGFCPTYPSHLSENSYTWKGGCLWKSRNLVCIPFLPTLWNSGQTDIPSPLWGTLWWHPCKWLLYDAKHSSMLLPSLWVWLAAMTLVSSPRWLRDSLKTNQPPLCHLMNLDKTPTECCIWISRCSSMLALSSLGNQIHCALACTFRKPCLLQRSLLNFLCSTFHQARIFETLYKKLGKFLSFLSQRH